MNIIDIILPNILYYLNSQHIMKHIMTITTMVDVHLNWDDKNHIHPDWDEGFILKSFACTSPEWTYQFSQLKGSSDDGNATLRLHFLKPFTKEEVTEEVICPKLQELLFFMHSFLTAKVASLDPSFMPPRP